MAAVRALSNSGIVYDAWLLVNVFAFSRDDVTRYVAGADVHVNECGGLFVLR